jgi:HEPN domain-containing protein
LSKEPSLAMEYFEEALAYQTSADRLHELLPAQPRIGLPLSDPVYFLYHHAAELALKACLLSHNLLKRRGHNIGALFEQCRQKHLLGTVDEHREMYNLMVFLNGKDYGQGYRYTRRSDFVPELAWVREGVRQLIADVEPHLKAWGQTNGIAGPWDPNTVTRLRYALGKPAYTKQAEPLKPGP